MSTATRTAAAAAQPPPAPAAPAAKPASSELDAAALSFSLSSGPPSSIRLDGLAFTKLVKHSRDAHPHNATGLLLGLDLDGALEVTNLFGLPRNALRTDDHDDSRTPAAATSQTPSPVTKHIQDALGLLASVNADANPVGIYVSSFLGFGAAFTAQVLEGLKVVGNLMDNEGSSPASRSKNTASGDGMEKAVVLVHDLAQSAQGNTVVKAYRLSSDFVAAYKANDFSAKGLIDHRLTFAHFFHELPLSLHNTALLDAFISTLATPQAPQASILPSSSSLSSSSSSLLSQPPRAAIESTYSNLTLAHTPVLSSALEQTLEHVDDYLSEAGNIGFQSRQLARERTRLEASIARRKADNASRAAQGLAPLPVAAGSVAEDEKRLEKLQKSEPSRLETTLMLGALDAKARRTAEESAAAAVRLEGAKAGTV
ncbi:hypothetical protein BDZ90DRAFT_230751 [Jaminaea rosea]|uniref:eIF3h C-terminal domain-containing protein n=1 Tax=Jaminaea rosea TaxID=1569628 RepID=A0A316UXV4_9BASI|nr:hypothetical protein BDZ90DRAFT_230751 [Jaminaea rosea]PWN28733.1 hypothetical protein BDZ90DRAFT_230751 [Jaminaea rosea]